MSLESASRYLTQLGLKTTERHKCIGSEPSEAQSNGRARVNPHTPSNARGTGTVSPAETKDPSLPSFRAGSTTHCTSLGSLNSSSFRVIIDHLWFIIVTPPGTSIRVHVVVIVVVIVVGGDDDGDGFACRTYPQGIDWPKCGWRSEMPSQEIAYLVLCSAAYEDQVRKTPKTPGRAPHFSSYLFSSSFRVWLIRLVRHEERKR